MNGCPNAECEFNKTYDFLYVPLEASQLWDINSDRPTRDTVEGRVTLRFPQLDYEQMRWVYITSNEYQMVSEEAWNRWLVENGCCLTETSGNCPFCGAALEPPGEEENIEDTMDLKKLAKIKKLAHKIGKLHGSISKIEYKIRGIENEIISKI